MRKQSRGSQKRNGGKDDNDKKQSSVKKKRTRQWADESKQENISWRDRFGDDLSPRRQVSPRKSPGELMLERYLIRDKQKEGEEVATVEEGDGIPIDVDQTLRRLSLPKPPSFHDICQDISSDKIDDDLNAGELRRRASLIQEQEVEIINQLQKSGSGTFHLVLERCESEDDLRKSIKRKSKKGKKVRHKITATVHIDNPPLTPIIQEIPEENESKPFSSKPKLKVNVEKIEEDHTVHKIFKLPKKRPKADKVSEEDKTVAIDKTADKGVPIMSELSSSKSQTSILNKENTESEILLKSKSVGEIQPADSTTSNLRKSVPKTQTKSDQNIEDSEIHLTKEATSPKIIKIPAPVQSLESKPPTPGQKSPEVKPLPEAQSQKVVKTPTTLQSPVTPKSPLSVQKPVKVESPTALVSPKKLQSPTEFQSPKNLKSPVTKKSSKPEFFTFDVDTTKTKVPGKVQTPQTPKSPKFGTPQGNNEGQSVAKPKPIAKVQKSNSGEDFWAQIGTRETLYMSNRKKLLLEQQWEKRESLFENKEVLDSNEEGKLNEMKEKIGSQKVAALKEADEIAPEKIGLKRSESSESVLTEVQEEESFENVLKNKENKMPGFLASTQKKETPTKNTAVQNIENHLKGSTSDVREKPVLKSELSNEKVAKNISKSKILENKSSLESPGKEALAVITDPPLATHSKDNSAKIPPAVIKTPLKPQSTTNSDGAKVLQQVEPKIDTGPKAKSPEISEEQDNRNIKNVQIPSAEENVPAAKKVSPPNKTKKPKSLNPKVESGHAAKTQSATPLNKGDVNSSASKESGRRGENVELKGTLQSSSDHQQNDKISTKETGSRKEDEQLTGTEKLLKGSSDPKQKPTTPGDRAPPSQSDVTPLAQTRTEKSPTAAVPAIAANRNSHESDKNDKIVGDGINDASNQTETTKDELVRGETSGGKLSKFPTVSDLNRCLQDVDAELSDYNPSEEDNSYDSSEDEGDSMKKKNRDKKKEEKFNPNKVIKLDHKKKCYVKDEAPPYPLVATPRPLWKREKFTYASQSDSESDESESDSECSTSNESSDELNPNKDNIIRMSTCSSDSGFEGGTAPSSPKKMLETSYTFSQFQKSGRITAPATIIPRFKKYSVEDFHFLAVLGKGSFGKVLLAELRNTEYYYAVKCLKKDVVLEDDDVECTLIERKVLALGTKHPYLCHLFCTFQTESHLFFVMEYLNGGDLMFHIQQSGRFPEVRARFYAAEIISGLKFLHKKGIIYRDLKLDNVLLDFDGHVRIADFGMCKLQIYLDKTADSFCGTPDYMAPEIIKGEKYNQNVDWWSFGVLLYEMLIGQSPFSGCDEDELFWSICNEIPWFPIFISQEATNILKGLLEKDSTARIGSQYSPAGDICSHPFFNEIDWQRLDRRELDPPFKPQVKHPLDTQYFDKAFTRERVRLTPIDKEILQSMDQEQFQGFSYTNPNATLN